MKTLRLHMIAPVALILVTSTVFAMPRRTHRVALSSAVVMDADATGVESAADGESRRMLAFSRAVVAPVAVISPEKTREVCDMVELAQGNGMVRRCWGVQ